MGISNSLHPFETLNFTIDEFNIQVNAFKLENIKE
jgi:hypothetical protein